MTRIIPAESVVSGRIIPKASTSGGGASAVIEFHDYDIPGEKLGERPGSSGYIVNWTSDGDINTASFDGKDPQDSHWEMYATALPAYDAAGNQVDLSTREYAVHFELVLESDAARYTEAPMVRVGLGKVTGGAETLYDFTGFNAAFSMGIIEGLTAADNRVTSDTGGPSDTTTGTADATSLSGVILPDWQPTSPDTLPLGSIVGSYRDSTGDYVVKKVETPFNSTVGTGEIGLFVWIGQDSAGTSAIEISFRLRAVAVRIHGN